MSYNHVRVRWKVVGYGLAYREGTIRVWVGVFICLSCFELMSSLYILLLSLDLTKPSVRRRHNMAASTSSVFAIMSVVFVPPVSAVEFSP